MIIGDKRTPGDLAGPCLGQANACPRGRAEPAPPRDWSPELGWPSWESPEMTREAVFSEGRGLRARIAKPYASRGIT
jgi:hypothetical protein